MRILLALLLLVALGAGLLLLLGRRSPSAASEPAATATPRTEAPAPPLDPASPLPSPATPSGAEDEAVGGTRTTVAGEPTAPPREVTRVATVSIPCRAVDLTGAPVAGVPVGPEDGERVLATSDVQGAFTIELRADASPLRLVARGRDHASVRTCFLDPADVPDEELLVVAPAVELAGTVVDDVGAAVPEAVVRAAFTDAALRSFPTPLDRTRWTRHETRTDASGRFELSGVPVVEGASLAASRELFEGARVDLPVTTRRDLRLELRRITELAVAGLCLLPDGEPARGARVRYGHVSGTADDEGRFRLEHSTDVETDTVLAAGLSGHGPAVVRDFGALLEASLPGPPPPQRLVLGPALSISGRVLSTEGDPLPGWTVDLRDATPASHGRFPPLYVEGLDEGHVAPATGEDGGFELTGLLARDYTVWAYDGDTLQTVEAAGVPAGTTDLVLEVDRAELLPRIAGTVVSRGGLPIPGAKVSAKLVTFRLDNGESWTEGRSAVTDDAGGFELADVPAGIELRVTGDEVVPESFELDASRDAEGLRLSVARRCHFRVLAEDPSLGQRFRILNAEGMGLPIYAFQAGGWSSSTSRSLEPGSTAIYAVSEDGVQLEITEGPEPLSIPITLDPEATNELRVELPR